METRSDPAPIGELQTADKSLMTSDIPLATLGVSKLHCVLVGT
jgi:hypothetical protein